MVRRSLASDLGSRDQKSLRAKDGAVRVRGPARRPNYSVGAQRKALVHDLVHRRELFSYLTGEYTYVPDSPARVADGKLWIAHKSSPNQPVQVARGLFPECPAWSPTHPALAYLIHGDSPSSWEMRLVQDYQTEVLKEFRIPAPSVFGPFVNRTFDFSTGGDLYFLARRSILVSSSSGVARFGPAGVLSDARNPDLDGWQRYVRALRVSPNADFVAATTDDDSTVIVDSDDLLRVADNRLRAWSGNYGIMTFGLTGNPTAALYPVDSTSPPRVIRNAVKIAIHADLGGDWFSYRPGTANFRGIYWRNPDGSVLDITELGFRAGISASIDGGVVDYAVHP
jgi:hypothetical protein